MGGGKILSSYPADPPKKVFITGPDSVAVGDEAEYGCVVEGGHPPPTPILVMTDQYQNPVQSIPVSNTSISVVVPKDLTTLYTSCFVGNEAGYLQTTKEITVTCRDDNSNMIVIITTLEQPLPLQYL